MTHRILNSLVSISLMITPAAFADDKPTVDLVIEDVTLVSPHLSSPIAHRNVVVDGDRIVAITSAEVTHSARHRIDGRDKFLLPGLIDSHVHINHNPLIERSAGGAASELEGAYRRQLPRSFLYYGYTSVIDLDFAPDRSRWFTDTAIRPALYHCGRGVRVAGGYGPSFVPKKIAHKVFPNLVYEPQYADVWPAALDAADYTPKAGVERAEQAGAICLKAFVESGFGGVFNWPVPSDETLRALSQEARLLGLKFVVHASSAKDWLRAINSDADVIVHGLWHWHGDRRVATPTSDANAALAAAVASGVAVQPTIQVVAGERETLLWQIIDDPRLANVLPKSLLEYVRSEPGRWSQRQLQHIYARHNPYPESTPLSLIDVSVERVSTTTRKLYQAGGTLLLGSDTPAQDGVGNPPGLNGYLEMARWVQVGVPLDAILSAATLANARAFGLDQELGSIEIGKQADLLLLNSNPLQRLEAYDDIAMLVVDGVPIQRDTLSARHAP